LKQDRWPDLHTVLNDVHLSLQLPVVSKRQSCPLVAAPWTNWRAVGTHVARDRHGRWIKKYSVEC